MFIILTIFLFIFSPLAMLILHLVRPRFSIQGFLAILTTLAGLCMIFLSRSDIPKAIMVQEWEPVFLFQVSPSFLIDNISWDFAFALTVLSLSVMIISISDSNQSIQINLLPEQGRNQVIEPSEQEKQSTSSEILAEKVGPGSRSNWVLWSAILILGSLGILAVTAGNLLTLLLAWAALDITQVVILLGQTLQSKFRERIIIIFSAKLAGMVMLFTAALILWSKTTSLSFDAISGSIGIYFVLAAGIRLGVLPLQLPLSQGLPMNRALGTLLRLIPAASSFILLARVANTGVSGVITPYLLGFNCLAGIYGATKWLSARDELSGRAYWLLGTASMAVTAAILRSPDACLAWGIGSLLCGTFIYSLLLRHRNLIPLIILGMFSLSLLPFSLTWQGTTLFQQSAAFGVNPTLYGIFSILFLLIQSFLFSGFIRHSLREIYPNRVEKPEHIEHWVWFLYPFGLSILIAAQLFFGWLLRPDLNGSPVNSWIIGPITVILTIIIVFITWRYPQPFAQITRSKFSSLWNNLLSLDWLYRLLWKLYRTISKVFTLASNILEGDGGILWALVLFGLIFVFLQR